MPSPLLRLLPLFLLLVSAAQAQLYVATGSEAGDIADFNFTIDPTLNRVTVQVTNAGTAAGGTLTSLGFKIPTTLLASVSLVSETWNVLDAGHTKPAAWTLEKPYTLTDDGTNFSQDFGMITGSSAADGTLSRGIERNEKVTFVLQFADFASISGFLGAGGVTADWQGVGESDCSDTALGFALINPPIPEPSAYGWAGVAVLIGIIVAGRRGRLGASRADYSTRRI